MLMWLNQNVKKWKASNKNIMRVKDFVKQQNKNNRNNINNLLISSNYYYFKNNVIQVVYITTHIQNILSLITYQ